MRKGIAIAFLPFILAGLASVLVIGLGGTIFQSTSSGIAKLGLVLLGLFAGFVILEKQRKQYKWSKYEIVILIAIVVALIYVIAGSGLPFSSVFKSIVSP